MTPLNSWPSVMGMVSFVHGCGVVGAKVGPPRYSCRSVPQMPTYAGATCSLRQCLTSIWNRKGVDEVYPDLSGAALGLSHIILNPDILFSIVSCCAHVCNNFAFLTSGLVSRSLSVVITLLMNAHSIMADIRSCTFFLLQPPSFSCWSIRSDVQTRRISSRLTGKVFRTNSEI